MEEDKDLAIQILAEGLNVDCPTVGRRSNKIDKGWKLAGEVTHELDCFHETINVKRSLKMNKIVFHHDNARPLCRGWRGRVHGQ